MVRIGCMRLLFSGIILIAFFACGQVKKDAVTTLKPIATSDTIALTDTKLKLNPGTLIQRINCLGSTDLNFALYIPSGFKDGENWPVLLLFDPHGDGKYPLSKYRNLADRYGYLLVGSNNSKNGNNREQTAAILQSLVMSAFEFLPLDSQRLYTGGFSGGGRVASMLAFSPVGIQGLVTCGAGFPAEAWSSIPPSSVIGMAGDADMNRGELINLNFAETKKQSRFQFIRFQGKHEWPEEEIFEQSFLAFQSSAIRDGLIKNYAAQLKQIENVYSNLSEKPDVVKNPLILAGIYERWIKSLDGLSDLTSVKDSYRELIQKTSYQEALKEDKVLVFEENMRRKFFLDAMGKNDTIWWRNQINILQVELQTVSSAKKNMISRVTGILSLTCYMNLNQALSTNNIEAINYLSTLYRIIDPENTEAWYLSALIASRNLQTDLVKYYLKVAIKKGFNDRPRILSEQSFLPLTNDQEFNQLLNQIIN